ncbi:MAG: ROK family transcriptional regulator, partial [Oscillospiraceae bacterium]|nr:ROK family transcriptional regulator [Oscillospiraceae bacterium]
MAGSITPGQIKKTNRQLIYDYIYKNRKVSQQDIAYALRLSRPTIATNLAELEEDGLIYKNGQLDSDQIGRKAVAYSITPDYRIAIGVEIMNDVVKIIAVDLYGKKIYRVVLEIPYKNQALYYKKVSNSILEFIEDLEVPEDKILGIGFAMQGLVSADGSTIVYGK